MSGRYNRLRRQSSPYLLQHADNPVHWQPWDDEALAEAVDLDKPILLSIGYSACHWCHVMAHESFESADTAELMNRLYVNIKVDREERPDLDRIYQLTHQLLTGRPGGWPLTVILTPRGHAPIFAGTYFPPEPRHGMPSFRQVLIDVEAHYRRHRDRMDNHDAAVKSTLAQLRVSAPDKSDPADLLQSATSRLLDDVDTEHGGFGRAPKFPHATALAFLLDRVDGDAPAKDALHDALAASLDAMAFGGMFDHIGGGFFRYSVDDRWSVPHFEKMLYDNALLMPLYARAAMIFGNPDYRRVALDTAAWALGEMQLADGGFCSSLDADSEGVEGKFYVFEPGEIDKVLEGPALSLARSLFGLDDEPNFEGRHHLNQRVGLDAAARTAGIAAGEAESLWMAARKALQEYRGHRVRPDRDDKCLTSWNALMITALARCGRLLRKSDLTGGAQRAFDFLRRTHGDGTRLLTASRRGRAHLTAYLDDYVFLVDAILELLQCRWRDDDLEYAIALIDFVLDHFQDPAGGGLFFTSDEHEQLLHRPKVGSDESIPSGNGIACRVLLELGHLLAETRYLDHAQSILESFATDMANHPAAHGALLAARDAYERPETRIIVRGDPLETRRWAGEIADAGGLRIRVYPVGDQPAGRLPGAPGATRAAATAAWICKGTVCLEPVSELRALLDSLGNAIE